MKDRLPLVVGFALLALAIGIGSALVAGGIRDRNRNDAITVTGSAKRLIVSDYIIWDVSVAAQQPTTAAALKPSEGWKRQIETFLRAAGAQPAEVTVQPISTETVQQQGANGSSSGRIVAYRLTRAFELRSARVLQIATLIERSGELLGKGVPLQAQPAQYVYAKLAGLRPSLLAQATRDALARAKALVQSTGGHVGSLRKVDVGVFQVTAPNSTQVSDLGVYDTSTLNKDVTAVVSATFSIA